MTGYQIIGMVAIFFVGIGILAAGAGSLMANSIILIGIAIFTAGIFFMFHDIYVEKMDEYALKEKDEDDEED